MIEKGRMVSVGCGGWIGARNTRSPSKDQILRKGQETFPATFSSSDSDGARSDQHKEEQSSKNGSKENQGADAGNNHGRPDQDCASRHGCFLHLLSADQCYSAALSAAFAG